MSFMINLSVSVRKEDALLGKLDAVQFCSSDLLSCPAPISSRLPLTALLSFVNHLVIFEHPSLFLLSLWCNVTSRFFLRLISISRESSQCQTLEPARCDEQTGQPCSRGACAVEGLLAVPHPVQPAKLGGRRRPCWSDRPTMSSGLVLVLSCGPLTWVISGVPGYGGCGRSTFRGRARGFRQCHQLTLCASARRSWA